MLDTYEGKENNLLGDMKIPSFKRMIIETKTDDQTFKKFDINMIYLLILEAENSKNVD